MDDGGNVGDPGKDGGDEAGRPHACVVEGLHGGEAALNGDGLVHIVLETFVERVDRPRDTGFGETLDEVEIAQDEVGLRCNGELDAAPSELFEDGAGASVSLLGGLVGVGHRAQEHLFARIPFGVGERLPIFDVYKAAPWLLVARKALHEARIAILAAVFAAQIGVEGIVAHGKIALCERIFRLYFADDHAFSFARSLAVMRKVVSVITIMSAIRTASQMGMISNPMCRPKSPKRGGRKVEPT